MELGAAVMAAGAQAAATGAARLLGAVIAGEEEAKEVDGVAMDVARAMAVAVVKVAVARATEVERAEDVVASGVAVACGSRCSTP